jgi:hypothetical protein
MCVHEPVGRAEPSSQTTAITNFAACAVIGPSLASDPSMRTMKEIAIWRTWQPSVVLALIIAGGGFDSIAELAAAGEVGDPVSPSVISPSSVDTASSKRPADLTKPKNLAELLALTPAELERVDMARRNLLCATRLPGSEDLDVETSLSALDELAATVRRYTDRCMPEYRADPYASGNKTGSEAWFRSLLLVSYLFKPFGVSYNPDFDAPPGGRQEYEQSIARIALDSRNSYLHGVLFGKKLGTCATIPELITAVGQRLGYPIKLVETKDHSFARWESSTERFNIEGTRGGLQTPTDDAYKNFPVHLDEEAIRRGPYLNSMTAVEETASFLATRSVILFRQGRDQEAVLTAFTVARLTPNARKYDGLLRWHDIFRSGRKDQ